MAEEMENLMETRMKHATVPINHIFGHASLQQSHICITGCSKMGHCVLDTWPRKIQAMKGPCAIVCSFLETGAAV